MAGILASNANLDEQGFAAVVRDLERHQIILDNLGVSTGDNVSQETTTDPPVIDPTPVPSPVYGLQVMKTNLGSVALTTAVTQLNIGTPSIDTIGVSIVSGNSISIPTSGIYCLDIGLIGTNTAAAGTFNARMAIYINGGFSASADTNIYLDSATSIQANLAKTISLNAGDLISIRVSSLYTVVGWDMGGSGLLADDVRIIRIS